MPASSSKSEPRSLPMLREMQQRSLPRYQYLLSLPPDYDQSDPGRRWPLILSLHGAGEAGPGGLDKLKARGVPRLVAAYAGEEVSPTSQLGSQRDPADMRCAALVAESAITVSPQVDYSRHGYGWSTDGLIRLLDELFAAEDGDSTAATATTTFAESTRGNSPDDRCRQPRRHLYYYGSHGPRSGGPSSPLPRLSSSSSSSALSSSGGAGVYSSGPNARASSQDSGQLLPLRDGSGGSSSGGARSRAYSSSSGGMSLLLGWDSLDGDADAAADADLSYWAVRLPLRVDPNRVYVTGMSMGGYGTWALGASYASRFAALLPLCGGGDPQVVTATALSGLPVWTFHGERDEVIPVAASEEVVRPLQAAGCPVRFTRYPALKHDCWTRVYNNPDVWHWLLEQTRQRRSTAATAGSGGGGGGAGDRAAKGLDRAVAPLRRAGTAELKPSFRARGLEAGAVGLRPDTRGSTQGSEGGLGGRVAGSGDPWVGRVQWRKVVALGS